jgi:hypothetical protein
MSNKYNYRAEQRMEDFVGDMIANEGLGSAFQRGAYTMPLDHVNLVQGPGGTMLDGRVPPAGSYRDGDAALSHNPDYEGPDAKSYVPHLIIAAGILGLLFLR